MPGKTYLFKEKRLERVRTRTLVYVGCAGKFEMFARIFDVRVGGPVGLESFTGAQMADYCVSLVSEP